MIIIITMIIIVITEAKNGKGAASPGAHSNPVSFSHRPLVVVAAVV
jgi:flavin reductase (DIM6/NTAB) family NADH-FMN oxidoreductase RutF